MYILGISCYYHDASATLLHNGKVVAAAAEERFTRKKHDADFPQHAIAYCLESAGISIEDIGYVGFYEKPLLKFERILHQHLETFPKSFRVFLKSMPSWLNQKLRVIKTLKKEIGYKGPVLFAEHHMSHAAGTYFTSPFEGAAIVTIDGVGEWSTTTVGYGSGNNVELKRHIAFPHSLGLLYSTLTAFLGFRVNNSEYKVMGLAAYGDMNRATNPYYKRMQQLIDVKPDGSYRLDMQYFEFDWAEHMPSPKMAELFEMPQRCAGEPITEEHKNLTAALQLTLEDTVIKILKHAHEETGSKNIVLSGGVALNSVMNGKILSNTPFEDIWVQPDAGDGGSSLGVALYVNHMVLGNKERHPLNHIYLGPSYTNEQIKQFLDGKNINYKQYTDPDELIAATATILEGDNVVGWFQDGMEWGPRALGARSILSNPSNLDMQEILNVKVKRREKFRPFAPVVCKDDAHEYFHCDNPVPEPTDYMLMVYPIQEQWHAKIPSVTHVDGSGRLQTVERKQNPLYYDLIKTFGKRTGIPILINTSFNIRGEPIVCTPQDAYRCMMGTQIDTLIMGQFMIHRRENEQDAWDSDSGTADA